MKKHKRKILIILAVTALAAVLGLVGYRHLQNAQRIRRAQELVSRLQQLLPPIRQGVWDDRDDMDMPVLQVDGENLCAWLQVPDFDCDLPVNSTWKTRDLSSLPCRYYGSIYDGSLVIGGTQRKGQLDFCDRIDTGHKVFITDMTGARYTYTVAIVERLGSVSAQILMDEEYDLTLYVKDSKNDLYILVRCVMT